MSNSTFKVTEPDASDSITLIMSPGGSVSPDKETVKAYLKSRKSVDINLVTMKHLEPDNVTVILNTLTYMNSEETEEGLDEISRNYVNFKLDHDYTPLTSRPQTPEPSPDMSLEDSLVQTLSMLEDGSLNSLTSPMSSLEQHEPLTKITKIVKGKKQSIFVTNKQKAKMISTGMLKEKPTETLFKRPKAIKNVHKVKTLSPYQETTSKPEKEEILDQYLLEKLISHKIMTDDNEYENENIFDDEEPEITDDTNDSDFEIDDEIVKTKQSKSPRTRRKSDKSLERQTRITKPNKVVEKIELEPTKPVEMEQSKHQKDEKHDKKATPKKDKKTPKPIPDDLALFSTPDIIRRVGSDKPVLEKPSTSKPAKISPDSRSKSSNFDQKSKRNSIDNKLIDNNRRLSLDTKIHEKRLSTEEKLLVNNKPTKIEEQVSVQEFCDTLSNESIAEEDQLEPLPSAEDIRAIIQNENTKSFTTSLVIPDTNDISTNDQTFENVGLDLDQSILDNINSDLISEDILYQVAQSLVDNIDLQNAIDKSIVDGNLVLDPNMTENVSTDNLVHDNMSTQNALIQENVSSSSSTEDTKISGTQVIRSDGRVVVIPPIERPTTRSRNKKQSISPTNKPKLFVQRPFDEEHVSGNELDSSGGEEESEDDPNKLWCVCNQPHNNRFMICCDTCEEWYHGKCVSVTKAMGHLMEAEGKEWICLFCKDSNLSRPKAAARRIRKASRTSTDSGGAIKKSSIKESFVSSTTSLIDEKKQSAAPGCVVCGNPSRSSSIYCSDECILKHAQGVEKAVVIDRKNGKTLSGPNAPTSSNLDKWLTQNPTYEVVRSTGKQFKKHPVHSPIMTQSKLKVVKNKDDNSVSLAVQKRGVNIGVMKHSNITKEISETKKVQDESSKKIFLNNIPGIKQSLVKTVAPQKRIKVVSASHTIPDSNSSTPSKPKLMQTKLQLTPITKENKEVKEKDKDRLPQPQKTPKARRAEVSGQPKQDNLRETVRKTFFEQLSSRLNKAEDLKLSEEELKEISNEIESQLFKCFGDTGQKYKNKYRSLIFNIKDAKNQTLWRRICEKAINPYQLVRLSPDDLASQELAMWREREAKHQLDMIKKSELELLSCTRQYVFKTHKGEQVFEDDRPKDQVTEVISGLGADSTSLIKMTDDNISSTDAEKSLSKHNRSDKSIGRTKDDLRGSSRDGSKDRTKSSHDRDSKERKKDKYSSSRDHHHHKRSGSRGRHADRKRSKSRDRDRHRRSSHKSSRHKKEDKTSATEKLDKKSKEILEQLVDKHIVPPLEDRLWKHVPHEDLIPATTLESDSDHEPSSTVTIPTPPRCSEPDELTQSKTMPQLEIDAGTLNKEPSTTPPPPVQKIIAETIWSGIINMIDVAQISITAKEVSGDCYGLGEELPTTLEIVGRISPETVWEYIGKMKSSNSKTISVLQLSATNMEEQMPYLALYSYLCSRNRLGVVKTVSRAVKDFYILPLAGHSPIPEQLLPITGPGFEESRPSLLLGILVRDKKRRLLDTLITHPTKKIRIDVSQPIKPTTPPSSSRSYTPPPTRDPRVKVPVHVVSTPSPTEVTPEPEDDMDEPYSPEDSDPDTLPETTNTRLNSNDISNLLTGTVKSSSFLDSGLSTQTFEPFSNKFETIPGLENSPALQPSSLELQRKMAELDQKIAAQKAEIDKVSKDLVSTASTSTDIGNSSLANISLPSNLQQILESIKTIGSKTDMDSQGDCSNSSISNTSDLTIPLMLPKLSSRSNPNTNSDNTIPLNIPVKSKGKLEAEKSHTGGLLSSLSEEDLIKKAAEMLGEPDSTRKRKNTSETPFKQSKISRFDVSNQPPIPGLEDS